MVFVAPLGRFGGVVDNRLLTGVDGWLPMVNVHLLIDTKVYGFESKISLRTELTAPSKRGRIICGQAKANLFIKNICKGNTKRTYLRSLP